ncbi:hypothetical protein GUJ93_ZPchr0002g24070 [Zizania palustris]|uniref:Uncharacterized protein n=1 Tax=Zizania palustris TaxID=103762 RepID=A0A8J5VTK9_ZIZPA|nr:hypothetical protein GUJ93_ZPchr0002g24070 [Zizania palustris]
MLLLQLGPHGSGCRRSSAARGQRERGRGGERGKEGRKESTNQSGRAAIGVIFPAIPWSEDRAPDPATGGAGRGYVASILSEHSKVSSPPLRLWLSHWLERASFAHVASRSFRGPESS